MSILIVVGSLLSFFFKVTEGRIPSGRPNIVFILTDDQDIVLGGTTPLEKTRKFIEEEGTTFTNAFATTPVCCPSRSSILTGLYPHSHGTVNNSIEGGCNSPHWQASKEPNSFGAQLHRHGYRTFYAGKYLNKYGHKGSGGVKHIPVGWDWWVGLVGNSVYYNYTLSVNGTKVERGDKESDYLTDVLKDYSLRFLNQNDDRPFLMVVSTPSPHEPFQPAKRHVGRFSGFKAPRTVNFNRAVKDSSKHWLLRLSPHILPPKTIDYVDKIFRDRWETLLAVDDLVEAIMTKLSDLHVLNNTFVIFSSDHGFHMGQFGQPWDKRQPYETDIRIPMMVRGPKVPNKKVSHPVLTIDIAPFILDVAKVPPAISMNGKSFLPFLMHQSPQSYLRSFLIEYQGEANKEAEECYDDPEVYLCESKASCKCFDAANNTFLCVRRLSTKANDIFCQFEDQEAFQEYYNIRRDPFQMNNLSGSSKAQKRKLVLDCCVKHMKTGQSVNKCLDKETPFSASLK